MRLRPTSCCGASNVPVLLLRRARPCSADAVTAPLRPRLRDDVERVLDGDRLVALRDVPLERRVPVGRLGRALVAAMDGQRTAAELVAAVAASESAPPADVEGSLRSLLLLHLLDGAGTTTVALTRAAARGETPSPPRWLEDGRFGCAGSGACCQVYDPGPLNDEDLARLEAAASTIRAGLPHLDPGPWFVTQQLEEGGSWRYLRRVNGRCLFLKPDGLCGVHATAGRDAKPDACRLFPFDAVRTVEGVKVWDISQCSRFPTTTRQGPSHATYAPETLAIAPRRLLLHHPSVALDEGVPCDYGPILALEAALLDEVGAPGLTAGERLVRLAARSRTLAVALATCPLEAGEPEATTRRALDSAALPLPPAKDAVAAVEAVALALLESVEQDGEREAPLALGFSEALAAAASLVARQHDPRAPLSPLLEAAAKVEVDGPLASETLRTSFRSRLFGGRLLVDGRLRAGVLRLAVLHLVTHVGARLRAASRGEARATEADLAAGHWVASLALGRRRPSRALIGVEAHAWTVAAAAARLG